MPETFVTQPVTDTTGNEEPRPIETLEDWAYGVACGLQRLALQLHDAEREDFEEHFRRYTPSIREARGRLEALWLREFLANFCLRTGLSFDRRHHPGQSVRCAARPMSSHLLSGYGKSRSWVRGWLRWFLHGFDHEHDLVVPVRGARLMLRAARRPVTALEIAQLVGCTPMTLERAFQRRYGLSPTTYHRRVRARRSALHLRLRGDKVSYVAWRSGYDSANTLYRQLDRTAGLTPTGIRELSSAQFEDLLNGPLETNPGRLRRRLLSQLPTPNT